MTKKHAPYNIIDGTATAKSIREEIKKEVEILKEERNKVPGLATIIVGENPGSKIYVNLKHKACEEVGIASIIEDAECLAEWG